MHPEVMTRPQQRVLALLGPHLDAVGSYLGGGTAVALQLGHRASADLDWFLPTALGDPLLIAARLEQGGVPFSVGDVAPGSLHGQVGGIRVSVLEYCFPLIAPTVPWPDYGCTLAGLDDLAAMKLSAIAQRGAKRDFIDIYALAVAHRPLPELLQTYQERYHIANIAHVLYGLTYTLDADRQRTPKLLWAVDWRQIKQAIHTWVRALL